MDLLKRKRKRGKIKSVSYDGSVNISKFFSDGSNTNIISIIIKYLEFKDIFTLSYVTKKTKKIISNAYQILFNKRKFPPIWLKKENKQLSKQVKELNNNHSINYFAISDLFKNYITKRSFENTPMIEKKFIISKLLGNIDKIKLCFTYNNTDIKEIEIFLLIIHCLKYLKNVTKIIFNFKEWDKPKIKLSTSKNSKQEINLNIYDANNIPELFKSLIIKNYETQKNFGEGIFRNINCIKIVNCDQNSLKFLNLLFSINNNGINYTKSLSLINIIINNEIEKYFDIKDVFMNLCQIDLFNLNIKGDIVYNLVNNNKNSLECIRIKQMNFVTGLFESQNLIRDKINTLINTKCSKIVEKRIIYDLKEEKEKKMKRRRMRRLSTFFRNNSKSINKPYTIFNDNYYGRGNYYRSYSERGYNDRDDRRFNNYQFNNTGYHNRPYYNYYRGFYNKEYYNRGFYNRSFGRRNWY